MYMLEGVSSVANLTTAYEESQYNRDSNFLVCSVLCFKRQSSWRLFLNPENSFAYFPKSLFRLISMVGEACLPSNVYFP